jgi:hypothetical protein
VLPLSLLLYAATLAVPITIPTWPVEGQWFFNPLAWQLIFVLGFVLARPDRLGGLAHRHIAAIRVAALPILAVFLVVVIRNAWPDPTQMPQPRLFFIDGKTFATPVRVIQFLALVAVMSIAYPTIRRFAAPLTDFLSMLGRNSLPVFCVGSLLSLSGQIAHFVYKGNIGSDTVVVIVGILTMALTARLAEWRDHSTPPGAKPSPQSG